MSAPPPFEELPRWVTQADGRLTPFDSDQIHRALFAASERLGQPDPFLARELTDSVLHFLAAESDQPVSAGQIHELVVKVVRELGQPALAQAFRPLDEMLAEGEVAPLPQRIEAQTDPLQLARELAAPALREYSLRSVYGPELAAAHEDGLLLLTGLAHPCELAAAVLDGPTSWTEAILDARQRVGSAVVIDGPEFQLADGAEPPALVRELGLGLRASGLTAIVNLNQATPPAWAAPAGGPLFAGQVRTRGRDELDRLADLLLESLPAVRPLRIDWHLGERDFRADQASRLLAIARRVAAGAPISLVFDRPRSQPALAEGIDRRHPYLLLTAGLNLPALAARSQPAHFLRKLGSLARLAISAGAQKRDFLRRARPALTGGFMLDRSRLVIVPVGLNATARLVHGQSMAEDATSLDFGRQVVQELADVLKRECASRQLESCVDSPSPGWEAPDEAGLTAGNEGAPLRQQLQASGTLHAVVRAGTACLRLPAERRLTADELVDLLRYAWQHTEVVRLRVERTPAAREPGELL